MEKLIKAIGKLTRVIQRKLTENDGWYVSVTMADNGWILDHPSNNSEGRRKIVIADPDAEDGSKAHQEAVESLLLAFKDLIGEYYSKHNEWNLEITLTNTNPRQKTV